MVSTPVKTTQTEVPDTTPVLHRGSGRVYSLERASNIFEHFILWDNTNRSTDRSYQVGRIGEFTMVEYRGQFFAEPSGRLDTRRFGTIEEAQAWLIEVYEQQREFTKSLGEYVVGKFAA